jgi:hypothetical protein
MDKTSNAQYSSNRFSRVKYGCKLTYIEAGNRLSLVDKDGSSIFDFSLDEVACIYRTGKIFLHIKLKDNTRHYISFGTILDSTKVAASQDSTELSYRATMAEWVKLFKSKGVKLKLPATTIFLYVTAGFFVLMMMLIFSLSLLIQS